MYVTIPLFVLIAALIICILSINLIIAGWRMYFNKTKIIFLPMKIGYFLAKFFLGKDEADQRKAHLLTPNKVKHNGIYALIGGGSLLIAGLYLLFDTISRIMTGMAKWAMSKVKLKN